MDAATRFDTHIVGALPVITNYLERLELARVIDELVPWDGDVPLGTLVEILVTNRLLNPKALFRIDAWAQKTGLDTYYGLAAGQLNDDRLGRALERVAARAESIRRRRVAAIARSLLSVGAVQRGDCKEVGAANAIAPSGNFLPFGAMDGCEPGRKGARAGQRR